MFDRGLIVLIDQTGQVAPGLSDLLLQEHFQVVTVASSEEATKGGSPEFVLFVLADDSPEELEKIYRLKSRLPDARILALGAVKDVRLAARAVQAGAWDYLSTSIKPRELIGVLTEAKPFETNTAMPGRRYQFGTIVGQSSEIEAVFQRITKVAASNSTVLITGESGTGKELIARAIHHESLRRRNPLVPVNCGAIPEELLESELFGHEKGAFTSAIRTRIGRFELADGGTVFLDEIGEMSPQLQVKLLRVLQEKQFERVGGTKTIQVDIRVVAATNQNLQKAVEDGRFREDLYYRLDVIPIHAPALRSRINDIPLLVEYFLGRFLQTRPSSVAGVDSNALAAMLNYPWPGNVRELENLIERMVILCDGPQIAMEDLPEKILGRKQRVDPGNLVLPDDGFSLSEYLTQIEDDLIRQALTRAKGVKKRAADILGVNRTTLVEKLKKKGIS